MPTATGEKPEYHLTLSDGSATVGLMGAQGVASMRRLPRGPGVERQAVVQRTWIGGRGNEFFARDTTRFFDSGALWSTLDGQITNGPLAKFAKGYRDADSYLPGSVAWQALVGSTAYVARGFFASANYSGPIVWGLLRKVGTPAGQLTCEIRVDNAGAPGAVLTSQALGSTPADWLSILNDWAGLTGSLTNGTKYWVCFRATGGTTADHYEIGVDTSVAGGMTSANGTAWAGAAYAPYFRLTGATGLAGNPRVHFFEYLRGLYCATEPNDGSAGACYLNGDRGVATGTQTTSTLKDTTKNWATDEWVGAVVLITGWDNKGEYRRITANDATTSYLERPWPRVCATGVDGSWYVILGSDKWTALSIGLTKPVESVAVCNGIVYLAQTMGTPMRRFREYSNAGVWTREAANDSPDAKHLLVYQNATGTVRVGRTRNADVSYSEADKVAWGSNLSFGTSEPVGDMEGAITGLCLYDGAPAIGKEDGLYEVRNGKLYQRPLNARPGRDFGNFVNMAAWNTNLYFAFLDGFERLYGSTVDDIGPNRGTGMPATRRGTVADFCPVLRHGFIALDCGDRAVGGASAILATNNPGGDWHEFYRAPVRVPGAVPVYGRRLRRLFYQSVPGAANRLWFQQDNDLGYLVLPRDTANPLNSEDAQYAWEGYVTTAWIDLDQPSPDKFFDELRLISKHLDGTTRWVEVDYQTDAEETTWTRFASNVTASPCQSLTVGGGAVRGKRIRFRLRLLTATAATPCVVNSVEARVNVMNEVLYDFVVDVRVVDRLELLSGGESAQTAAAVVAQLAAWQENGTPLTLRCVVGSFDNLKVHLDPVALVPERWDPKEVAFVGSLTLKQT